MLRCQSLPSLADYLDVPDVAVEVPKVFVPVLEREVLVPDMLAPEPVLEFGTAVEDEDEFGRTVPVLILGLFTLPEDEVSIGAPPI